MLVDLALYQFSDDFPVAFVEAVGSPPPACVPVVDGPDSNIFWLNVSKQHLDAILPDVTTLTCSKAYPYWTSKAYCQLTELHLTGSFSTSGIDENHFLNILKSSPNSRVSESNLYITNTVPAEAFFSHDSISLRKLEILRPHWQWHKHQNEAALRWFAPVLNPLQVSILSDIDADLGATSTKAFLTVSNLSCFHTLLSQDDDTRTVANIFSLEAHTLVIERLGAQLDALIQDLESKPKPHTLDTLYPIEGDFVINQLRRFLELSSIKRIIAHGATLIFLSRKSRLCWPIYAQRYNFISRLS